MKSTKNIFIAFLLNLIFSIIEFFGGMFTNSVSIMSDSIHDFGDAISLAIAYFLEKKSEKKPDEEYTYGYARYSTLGGFITSTILLVGSIFMIYNACIRLQTKNLSVNYDGMFLLAILGLVINALGAFITSKGKKVNEKAVSLHLLEDLFGWIAVLIISIVMKITNIAILDPILSICISLFVIYNVYKNYIEILNIVLEKKPKGLEIEKIKEEIKNEFKEVVDVHHVHVWTLDGINSMLTMHIVFKKDIDMYMINKIKKHIKEDMKQDGITHSTIETEIESELCNDEHCEIKIENTEHAHHHHH